MTAWPEPEVNSLNRPYWDGLAQGRLMMQACACGHRWLPARQACPACLGTQWAWQPSAGAGRLLSWVVYHVAFHDAFRDRLPYNVALVELDEGPRLITNIVAEPALLTADARVQLAVAQQGDHWLARFGLTA